ncbi:MAG: 3'-5' exonuclease [Candidatus Hodarchaeales archaeon]
MGTLIILGLDLETNGIGETDFEIEIVEFGGVLFHVESKTVLASFGKIYTINHWSDEAAECHHIPKELSDLMPIVPIQDQENPYRILSGDLADIVVAHNAPHDHPHVVKHWPDFLQKPWLCTQRDLNHNAVLPRKAYSKRLGHLCVDYGIKLDNWHRALVDAEACARIAGFHDLKAALEYKNLPKFRLITWGDQRVGKVSVNEKLREAPTNELTGTKYRWNTDEYPKAWVKEGLLEEHVILDAKYIKDVSKGKWSFNAEKMDPRPY